MRKDSFSQEELRKLYLNDRQVRAVMYVKEKGRITNKEYRGMFDITDRVELIDLFDICAKNIFERIGKTGKAHVAFGVKASSIKSNNQAT